MQKCLKVGHYRKMAGLAWGSKCKGEMCVTG